MPPHGCLRSEDVLAILFHAKVGEMKPSDAMMPLMHGSLVSDAHRHEGQC
jgi:hypothetical protein